MGNTPEEFGRSVIGPITGEFCLRLWSLGSMLDRPEETATLFCARGGLRLKLLHDRFLAATGLMQPTQTANLMVSRLAAIRPAIMRSIPNGSILPATAAALSYEFANATVEDVVRALSGHGVGRTDLAGARFTPALMLTAITSREGVPAVTAMREQAALFERHLKASLDGRRRAILVDTGLFGTTAQVLSEAMPETDFSCAMIARANYRGSKHAKLQKRPTFGLGIETTGYSPANRRSAILRYWHLIESTFEPRLQSVRTFADVDGTPVSNLEVPGWRGAIAPEPGTVFAGAAAYVDGLGRGDASRVTDDAAKAWQLLYEAVVWPTRKDAIALDVGARSNDFGSDSVSVARAWRGPMQALRGPALWREGEIARSGTRLRPLLLAGIEAAYGLRHAKRWLRTAGRN